MNFKSIFYYFILTCTLFATLFCQANTQYPLLPDIPDEVYRWPLPTVEVVISPAFNANERFIIERTIRHFNLFSPLTFNVLGPQLSSSKIAYLNIVKVGTGTACSTKSGYKGHPVDLNFGPECMQINSNGFYGKLFHELGHVCRFCHLQAQPDRDTWVRINTENIKPSCLYQYRRRTSHTVVNMAVNKFEYGSIMGYEATECGISAPRLTPTPITTVPLNRSGDYESLGQRKFFTPLDLQKLLFGYYPNTTNAQECKIGEDHYVGLGVYYTANSCPKHTVLVGSHGQYCTLAYGLTGRLPVCLDASPELAYTNFEDWQSFYQVFRDPRWYTWEKKSAKVFPSSWMTGDYTYFKLDRHVLMLNVANESARSETLRTHWWPLAGYASRDFCIEFAAFFSYSHPANKFTLKLIAEVQQGPNAEPKEHECVGIENQLDAWFLNSYTLSFRANYTAGAKVAFGWIASSDKDITTHQWLALDNVRVQRNGVCRGDGPIIVD